MNEKIKEFWNQLSERDRLMLVVGGVICFFYLFYALCYAPVADSVEEQRSLLVEKRETLDWMKQVRPQAHPEKKVEALDSAQLLTALSNRLKSTSFHGFVFQLQQAGPKDIQLSFEEVPYNPVMTWLSDVSQEYAFSIKQLDIERTGKAGVVKFSLVIEVA